MNFELTDLSNVTERAGCAGCSCRHSEQMFALFIYLFFVGNYCAPAHSPRERGSKKLVALPLFLASSKHGRERKSFLFSLAGSLLVMETYFLEAFFLY
jgi:hypothetical protein